MEYPLTDTDRESAIKKQRRRNIRVAGLLLTAILGIEFAALFYLIYTLGLHRDGRWIIAVAYDISFSFIIAPTMIFFCLRWAKDAIEFGRITLAGKEPTIEQAEKAVRSIYKFARNGAILLFFLYESLLLLNVWLLYKWHGFSPQEVISIYVFKVITGLNLSIISYYAIKIIEQPRIDEAVKVIFGAGVYKLKHFKLRIRYKMFMIIFSVVAYILCSVVFVNFAQVANVQKMRLQENLDYWVKKLPERTINPAGGVTGLKDTGKTAAEFYYPDKLGARSHMIIFTADGAVLSGDASDISPEETKKIISTQSLDLITDQVHNKLIAYSPFSEGNLFVAAVGYWGASADAKVKSRNVVIALLTATLILSIVATYLLVGDINTPLGRLLDFLRAVSSGEVSGVPKAYSEDEMGDLARELARTTALLENKTNRANELLERIQEAASAIDENASMAQASAEQQVGEASEQAGAVVEALSASSEIVATAREIAENATDVQKSAEENLISCQMGNDRVGEALEGFKSLGKYVEEISNTVATLGDDVRQITEVIKVIENVAIQINLLSLNAQIEAAGASEEGMRFGGVVDDVKRLADNTMNAVKRISALVDSTLESTEEVVESAKKGSGLVEKGTELADSVGQTLKNIEQQAASTEMVARKITITTTQQKTASEQMAETISEINDSAQQIESNTDNVLKAMAKLSETAARLAVELREKQ